MGGPASIPGRLFSCARCDAQVVVCVSCFRGHRYCEPCRPVAWAASRSRARATYARSPEGRLGNADRQREFRDRARLRRAVTDHGSPAPMVGATVHPSGGDSPEPEVSHDSDLSRPHRDPAEVPHPPAESPIPRGGSSAFNADRLTSRLLTRARARRRTPEAGEDSSGAARRDQRGSSAPGRRSGGPSQQVQGAPRRFPRRRVGWGRSDIATPARGRQGRQAASASNSARPRRCSTRRPAS